MARILVIDDTAVIRAMIRRWLEVAGHEVEEAEDGDIGIEKFRANPADLVITDLIMPHKEGLQVIRELHQEFPGVKIIAISAGGQIEQETQLDVAKKLGASRTFRKTSDWKEIIHVVNDLLGEGGSEEI
jgi:CheY-like chemotaxis protein